MAFHSGLGRAWTVAEAKARLSEVLRLSEDEGPQRIGMRRSYVVVPERLWKKQPPSQSLGKWLVENAPRGTNLEIPDRRGKGRKIPFIHEDTD